jgi:hypothetical protein
LDRLLPILLALTVLSSHAFAGNSLTPHTARYEVTIGILGGELVTRLRETPDGYEASHVIYATGITAIFLDGKVRESSQFVVAADSIRPQTYRSRDTLTSDGDNATVHFDWDAGEARGTVNGEPLLATIDGLAHDRVSIHYQLMRDLMSGEPADAYLMFEVDKMRPLNVTSVGKKTVDTPAGRFEVVGIRHQAEGSKRATTLWCAEELGYLPVIIEQYRKGKLRARAELIKYRPVKAN